MFTNFQMKHIMQIKVFLITILTLVNLAVGVSQTTYHKHLRGQIENLTSNTWTSIDEYGGRLDSLKFLNDSILRYYPSQLDWNHYGLYSINQDSLHIVIYFPQLDANNFDLQETFDPHKRIAKWILRIKPSELEWLQIEHSDGISFIHIDQEICDRQNSFIKND